MRIETEGSAGSGLEQPANGFGYKAWPWAITSNNQSANPTSGQIQVVGLYVPAGTTLTGVAVDVNAPAAGTKPTGVWVGVADSTGKMLAQSGDLSAPGSGAPFTATGPLALPFSAAYTTPTAGIYYAVELQVGTFGTTQVSLEYLGGNAAASSKPFGSNPAPYGVVTGQTGLPANGSSLPTITVSSGPFWLAFY